MKIDNIEEAKQVLSRLHSGITDAEFERRKCEVVEQMDTM